MTRQITAIVLRLCAIWLLVQLILNIPSLVMLIAGVSQYHNLAIPKPLYVGTIGSIVVIGSIAVFLLNKAANSVLSCAKTESQKTLDVDSQKVLLQMGGLYFIVTAIVYLIRALSFIPEAVELNASQWFWPVGLMVQLILGVWLISSPVFWVRVLAWLRGRHAI